MITRRAFCQTSSMLAAAMCLPRGSSGQDEEVSDGFFKVTPLRGGAVALGALNDGGTVLLVPADLGPIIVDAKFAHVATLLAKQARARYGKYTSVLFNTHHHADHTGGNWYFKSLGNVLGHMNLIPRIEANLERYKAQADRGVQTARAAGADDEALQEVGRAVAAVGSLSAEDFTPNVRIGPRGTWKPAGVHIETRHFGPGHTDNDIVVYFPEHNIMHMGDLVFHNLHPFIDRGAGATTRGWQICLNKAAEMCDDETQVVAGHGGITDLAGIRAQITYFDQLRDIVSKAIAAGKSRDDITAMTPEPFKDRGFKQLQGHALGMMFDELKPDAAEG